VCVTKTEADRKVAGPLEFRGEALNIANTPQYNTPDQNLQDANFGRITGTQAGTERHIQFQLRLQF
jgi:hypothetical protein